MHLNSWSLIVEPCYAYTVRELFPTQSQKTRLNRAPGIDAFGNASKSVLPGSTGYNWAANYSSGTTNNNRYTSVSGANPTYDSNGNVLTDTFHTYVWDAEGKIVKLDTTVLTYDAMGRMVAGPPLRFWFSQRWELMQLAPTFLIFASGMFNEMPACRWERKAVTAQYRPA